jgi:hypothetical protein
MKRQYRKHILFSVLSFYIALAVVKSKSMNRAVAQNPTRQYIRRISCFLLPTQQSRSQKASLELSPQPKKGCRKHP